MKRNIFNYSVYDSFDDEHVQIEHNKSNMHRIIKMLFIIFLSNVTCVFFLLYGVDEDILFSLLVVCFFLLAWMCYGNMFEEFSLRTRQRLMFYESEYLYDLNYNKCAPLINDGYIYVTNEGDKYAHPLKVCIFVEYPPIIDITSNGYYIVSFAKICGDIISKTSYSGNRWVECRIKAIKDLEKLGYTVHAISNNFGDYVWKKGNYKNMPISERIGLKIGLYSVKIICLILVVLPLIYLFLIC